MRVCAQQHDPGGNDKVLGMKNVLRLNNGDYKIKHFCCLTNSSLMACFLHVLWREADRK